MHEIDRSFRAKRVEAADRRALTLRRRILAIVFAAPAVAIAAAGYFAWQYLPSLRQPVETAEPAADPDAVADTADAKQKPVFVNPIIDLAGDPLIINLGDTGEANSKLRDLEVTKELKQPSIPDEVNILSDVMLSSSERIMALPSSPDDFAFFQSQSARARPLVSVAPAADEPVTEDPSIGDTIDEPLEPDAQEVLVPVASQDDLEGATSDQAIEEEVPIEDGIPTDLGEPSAPQQQTGEIGEPDADVGAGWGETVSQGQEALPEFKKTQIEDITTVQLVKPEAERFRQIEDFTVSVKGERSLDSIITEYGFSADDAKAAADAARQLISVDKLEDRSIIGLRGHRTAKGAAPSLAQVSVNAPGNRYFGTIARADDGGFEKGADPWINEDLSQYADKGGQEQAPQSYRLLDAIYSTATRNSVPSSVTGEAIMLISRSFDLQAMATRDDRLVLVFAKEGRGKDQAAGRVLYVAVKGVDRNFECFVYQPTPDADFACMTEKDATHSVTVTSGMVTPVKGVMTSTFGPRLHPILGKVRIHKGVDWGAPIGTPIVAAFDGAIAYAGDGKGYGNVVRIDHGGGKATAYAHMSRFEKGIAKGVEVRAGDTIGYVGTTGLSTGPHLHFEVYLSGVAVDPLGSLDVASAAAGEMVEAGAAAGTDGSAVELLVNRIVHVESGGNARAKNPLSSASGLGQFIKSTWLRMMRTYRPELFKSMSEAEILELRFDPTMARQMVANLARENESRLRARGHSITAGRLYLAHFLGPEGAHLALAAPGNASVAGVLGASVVSANPFLTGKDCAYVVAWAEKKMSGRAPRYKSGGGTVGVTTKTIVKTSPEFIAYRDSMLKLVGLAVAPAGTPPPAEDDVETPGDEKPADASAPDGGIAPADGEAPDDAE
jgi:murein DD-endopeptidase MepM/ murein hydrolase activator NlpD